MTRCAYCHAAGGALRRCGGCGTLLHAECRAALGRCPTLGCAPCRRSDRPLSRLGRALLRWALGP